MMGSLIGNGADISAELSPGTGGLRSPGLLVTLLMSVLWAGVARPTTFYVARSGGSDSNTGTSLHAPWATIGKANATLQPGDTVYVRAGTYDEIIEPYQSGAAGAPITYRNYQGEAVTVQGGTGQPYLVTIGARVNGNWNPKSYIVVDGFTIMHSDPKSVATRPVLVFINGRSSSYNVIRNCTILGQGTPTWQGGWEDGVEVYAAQHTTIENNHLSGYPRLGIVLSRTPQYTVIRGNDLRDCVCAVIDIGSGFGTMQYTLIENNTISHSVCEDGIQFEHDESLPADTVDADSNRGTIIQNNLISDHGENAIDLKGAAYLIIQDNFCYGCLGNNDGGLNPADGNNRGGGFAIAHGTGAGSRNVVIRRNVVYDNAGGIEPEDSYKVYHNTVIYNNRDYTGPNSRWSTADGVYPWFAGINLISGRTNVGVKNNIVGGHNGSDITLGRGAPRLDINYNLYFGKNGRGARLTDYRGGYNWSYVAFSRWSLLLSRLGVPGAEARSRQAAPLMVNVPADLTGPSTKFDFHLQAGSPALDHGGFLTTTTSAGQGRSLPVQDAGYFFDGFGFLAGDTIQLEGQTVTAKIVSIGGNTLVVDKDLTWSAGQGVSLPYQGSAPDMGAYEYGVR